MVPRLSYVFWFRYNQGTNARKVNCGRVYSAYILEVYEDLVSEATKALETLKAPKVPEGVPELVQGTWRELVLI